MQHITSIGLNQNKVSTALDLTLLDYLPSVRDFGKPALDLTSLDCLSSVRNFGRRALEVTFQSYMPLFKSSEYWENNSMNLLAGEKNQETIFFNVLMGIIITTECSRVFSRGFLPACFQASQRSLIASYVYFLVISPHQ